MSEEEWSDDEVTAEDEKEDRRRKREVEPLKLRKRGATKRGKKGSPSNELPVRSQDTERSSEALTSTNAWRVGSESSTPPLHVQLSTELIPAPLQGTSTRKIPRSQKIEIHSPSRTKWLPIIAFLDTGTPGNWISQRIVDRGGFRPRYGETMHYCDFNGVHLQSDAVVEATWHGEGSDKTHEAEFRVGRESAPFDVLFGRNTLNSAEASACLTTDLLDSGAVLVQLKACNAEVQAIKDNQAKNEAAAAELEKEQQLKKLKGKEVAKPGQNGNGQTSQVSAD